MAENGIDHRKGGAGDQGGFRGAIGGREIEILAAGQHAHPGADTAQGGGQIVAVAGRRRHIATQPGVEHRQQVGRIMAAIQRQPNPLDIGLHAGVAEGRQGQGAVEGLAGGPTGVDQGKGP